MKKSAAIFMIILMILNICACKRVPEDTEGVSLPAASEEDKTEDNGTGALSPTPPAGQEDTAPEKTAKDDGEIKKDTKDNDPTDVPNTDKTDDKVPTDTTDTDQPNGNNAEPQEETDPQPEQNTPQPNVKSGPDTWVTITEEKAPPCNATIDADFIEGEVVVVIMHEQSAARQEYTAEDFPGVDIKEIHVLYDYYPDDIDKDVKNVNMILSLELNKADKPSVIDAIKKLEQNPIVYSAEPNYIFHVIYP